jgi:hypothetical protein
MNADYPSQPGPKPQVVRADHGAWISGPGLPVNPEPEAEPGTELVAAAQIKIGDIVVHHGRHLVVVEAPVRCWYYQDGARQVGVEIVTAAQGSRWVLYRHHAEPVVRLSDGAL